MTCTAPLAPPAPAAVPAVPSRRTAWLRRPWWPQWSLAAALRRALRRQRLDEDGRHLAAAHSLEDLERRQRRLERHGSPLPPAWLP